MTDKPTWPLPPAPFNPGGPVQMLCPEPQRHYGWVFELAQAVTICGEYQAFEEKVSNHLPDVPAGAVRNIRALYVGVELRPSDLELMKFYGVNSPHGLIDRMEEQIKHLQEARSLRDEQPRRVRLG